MHMLHIAGDPGLFGPLLQGLRVPVTVYPETSVSKADKRPETLSCRAGRVAEELAETGAERLEMLRDPVRTGEFHAAVRHIAIRDGRIIHLPPGPDLLRETRGRSVVVASAIAVRPVEELSLPTLSSSVVIELALDMKPLSDGFLRNLERTRETEERGCPNDRPAFLLCYARRARCVRNDGYIGEAVDPEEYVGRKREELRGLLDIAGFHLPKRR